MSPSKNDEIASSSTRVRCNTGESRSGGGGGASTDLFDFLATEGAMTPLRSADFVEDFLLPKTAAAGPVSAKAGPGTRGGPSIPLDRNVTGDDIAPLNMKFRISSGNWIGDYEAEESKNVSATAMHPSLFQGVAYSLEFENAFSAPPLVSLIDGEHQRMPRRSSEHKAAPSNNLRITSSDWVKDFQDEPASSETLHPGVFTEFMSDASADTAAAPPVASLPPLTPPVNYDGEHHIPLPFSPPLSVATPPLSSSEESFRAVSPVATQGNAPQSSTTATPENSRKATLRTRQLDETVVAEPVDNDVLCGRGGFTNNHPGNVRFREKALEFRPWYERSSKEEKQGIADLLVESITSQGYRFLGKGKDGLWHEMVHGAHRKASQALRERIKQR